VENSAQKEKNMKNKVFLIINLILFTILGLGISSIFFVKPKEQVIYVEKEVNDNDKEKIEKELIDKLEQEKEELTNSKNELSNEISTLKEDNDNKEKDISDLNDKISNLNKDLAKAKEELNKLFDLKEVLEEIKKEYYLLAIIRSNYRFNESTSTSGLKPLTVKIKFEGKEMTIIPTDWVSGPDTKRQAFNYEDLNGGEIKTLFLKDIEIVEYLDFNEEIAR
jgi:septal ring factor EnvC (AmiA/AmiB activator)